MSDDRTLDPEERIRALEARLDEIWRYELLGRLVGGVAHDFNNVLSVVTTLTDLLLRFGPPDDPAREDLEEIRRAAERGSTLTRQVVAFARTQPGSPVPTDPNARIDGTIKLFRKLLPEDYGLEVELAEEVPEVLVDPPEIDQMLLNFAAYAREMMPGGGAIRLGSGGDEGGGAILWMVLDPTDRRVVLESPPTGEAGSPGLAPIGRILDRRGARMELDDDGLGVRIRFPATSGPGTDESPIPGGDGRLALVVEDDEAVRQGLRRLLERLGFEVSEVASIQEAVDRMDAEAPDLVVSDAVLRDGWGTELRARSRAAGVEAHFLFVSGHETHPAIGVIHEAGLPIVRKPVGFDALARAIGDLRDDDGPTR